MTVRGYVVTGAASGIGRELVRALVARGDRVVGFDAAADGLAALAVEHAAAASVPDGAAQVGLVATQVVDVTDGDGVGAALAGAARELGGTIDGVLHCAGILRVGLLDEVPLAAHRATIDVNLWGTVCIAAQAVPYLRASRGALVLMASASGLYGPPEYGSYAATKAGVVSLAQTLHGELAAAGVYVATCCPLLVQTAMVAGEGGRTRLALSEGVTHTPEQVAASILRAVDRRRSLMVWPSLSPWRLWLLSRYLAFAAPALMTRAWQRAARHTDAA